MSTHTTPEENNAVALEKEKVLSLKEKLDINREIQNDDDLKKRSKIYNEILDEYKKSIHKTLTAKHVYKIITYIIVNLIFIAITTSTIILFFIYSKLDMVKWISIVIPIMISFLTTFIVIPKIITNYLFDKNEEKRMTELLKILVEYDKNHLK